MTAIAQSNFGEFWSLLLGSGVIAIAILLVLGFFSLLSWTIIFRKLRFFKEVERDSLSFHHEFQSRSSLSEIYQECNNFPLSPLAGIFKSGYEELTHRVRAAEASKESSEAVQRQIIANSLSSVERTLRKAAMAEMMTLEKSLNWLATTGAVSPFIGLFGTVVGIIDAFAGLGEGGPSTIQAVAPGISAALIATAAGLFAAIPAVIAYNHFLNRLRHFGAEMDDFSVELINLIERSFT